MYGEIFKRAVLDFKSYKKGYINNCTNLTKKTTGNLIFVYFTVSHIFLEYETMIKKIFN